MTNKCLLIIINQNRKCQSILCFYTKQCIASKSVWNTYFQHHGPCVLASISVYAFESGYISPAPCPLT